jgi:hypothetical protein
MRKWKLYLLTFKFSNRIDFAKHASLRWIIISFNSNFSLRKSCCESNKARNRCRQRIVRFLMDFDLLELILWTRFSFGASIFIKPEFSRNTSQFFGLKFLIWFHSFIQKFYSNKWLNFFHNKYLICYNNSNYFKASKSIAVASRCR